MKRKTVSELAATSVDNRGKCWFDFLPKEDQAYVLQTVDELLELPEIPILAVATGLVKELEIDRTPRTVESFLSKRMRYVAMQEKS